MSTTGVFARLVTAQRQPRSYHTSNRRKLRHGRTVAHVQNGDTMGNGCYALTILGCPERHGQLDVMHTATLGGGLDSQVHRESEETGTCPRTRHPTLGSLNVGSDTHAPDIWAWPAAPEPTVKITRDSARAPDNLTCGKLRTLRIPGSRARVWMLSEP